MNYENENKPYTAEANDSGRATTESPPRFFPNTTHLSSEAIRNARKQTSENLGRLPKSSSEDFGSVPKVTSEEHMETSEVSHEVSPLGSKESERLPIILNGEHKRVSVEDYNRLRSRYTLTPHQVARMTEEAEVRRSTRAIQDWCKTNGEAPPRLESIFLIDQNRYFILEESAIAEVKRLVAAELRKPEPELPKVTSEGDEGLPNESSEDIGSVTSSTSEDEPAGSEEKASSSGNIQDEVPKKEKDTRSSVEIFHSGDWVRESNPDALRGLLVSFGVDLVAAESRNKELTQAREMLLDVVKGNAELYEKLATLQLPDREARTPYDEAKDPDAA